MLRLFRQVFLPLPAVTPLFIWTGAVVMVLIINLVAEREIWPHTPAADRTLWALLLTAVSILVPQAMRSGWKWLLWPERPWWANLLLRACLLPVLFVGVMVEVGALIAMCWAWARCF